MADIPGGPRTTATLPRDPNYTYGRLERDGDSDWYRIDLNKGVNYAFNLDTASPFPADDTALITLNLRDPQGRIIESGIAIEGEDFSGGFELRPARSGTYFVEVEGDEAVGYDVRAAADAAADLRSRAAIDVGETRDASFFYGGDVDVYRVDLRRGETYDFAAASDGGSVSLELLDPSGRVAARGEAAGSDAVAIEDFAAPATGTYLLRADDDIDEFPYEYTISAAPGREEPGPATVRLTPGDDDFSADDDRAVTVRALAGDDDVDAFGDGSVVFGDGGDDTLFADTVFGGAGSDELTPLSGGRAEGGTGDDLAQVGGNANVYLGGPGRETYLANGGTTDPEFRDTLADFEPGEDRISFELIASVSGPDRSVPFTFVGTDPLDGPYQVRFEAGGGQTLVEASGNVGAEAAFSYLIPREVQLTADSFLLGVPTGPEADSFAGTPYADVVEGFAGNDALAGGPGRDALNGADGDDTVDGGDGRDGLSGGQGTDTVRGGGGDDRLTGGLGGDEVFGGTGDDEIVDGAGFDRLYGEDGNDRINADSSDEVVGSQLFGGTGDDVLEGGFAADDLFGEEGADRLSGGFGADDLAGGAGGDRFVFGADYLRDRGVADTIVDFARGDRVDLAGIDANRGRAGDQAFEFVGMDAFSAPGQVRFTSDGGETVVEGSTDLDRVAEFRVELDDMVAFRAADFVL